MDVRRLVGGLLLEVRPLPMAAAVLSSLLGMEWAGGRLQGLPAGGPSLLAAVFFGLFSAHLMDSYIDVVKRNDLTPSSFPLLFRDSTGLVPPSAYPPLIATSALLTAAFAVQPILAGGPAVAAPVGVGLGIALAYAPLLDRHPLGVTLAYPLGVSCAAAAGYALAADGLDFRFAGLAAALLLALAGTKIRSDIIDLEDDRRISKRTVAVLLGEAGALRAGYGLALAGLVLVALLPLAVPVTAWFAAPAVVAAVAMAATSRLDPFPSSMLMAASLFALLVAELAVLAFAA